MQKYKLPEKALDILQKCFFDKGNINEESYLTKENYAILQDELGMNIEKYVTIIPKSESIYGKFVYLKITPETRNLFSENLSNE